MSQPQDLIPDEWLSQICGWPCFRVSPGIAGSSDDIAARLTDTARNGDAFFYIRIPVEEAAGTAKFIRAGFRLVDTGLTLEYHSTDDLQPAPPFIAIAEARQEDIAGAAHIAANDFRYSRFHLDPQFPPVLANRIKEAWIESYGKGTRGESLYIARRKVEPEGFLAVLLSDGGRTAIIDLIAVASASTRLGIGRALVRHFIETWKNKVTSLQVGTQAANISSLRLYESCGFKMLKSSHVLHAHLRQGKIVS